MEYIEQQRDEGQPIGDLLDGLGVRAVVDEGDLISDALVIVKWVDPDGDVGLKLVWSDGMSWVERLGMLHAAIAIETPSQGD